MNNFCANSITNKTEKNFERHTLTKLNQEKIQNRNLNRCMPLKEVKNIIENLLLKQTSRKTYKIQGPE